MKSLKLHEMENLNGGNRCDNASNSIIIAGLIAGTAVTVLAMGAGCLIGVAIATGSLANCHNGWLSDMIG
ncbi:hypothetical protein [Leeuwenhoekiella sp. MAR_2009_132]|uniref:hypothetical protein n=1 Tax=Leeuwenhoekiella sp. MAR_2009_132 TaxID=1392489 RepID=UPI00048FCF67|nr:hypothetical protein [Leeuwenhoekiella sp. MAR_2009_132]